MSMFDHKEVASEILDYSRINLCMDLRFMTQPVLSIDSVLLEGDGPYSSDSSHLYFYADRVISDYMEDPNMVSRAMAHMVMHLVLGHFSNNLDKMQDLAEDMIVEYTLDMLDTPHVTVPGKDDRIFVFERLMKKAGAPIKELMAAELAQVSSWQIGTYPPLFVRDSHKERDGLDHPEWAEMSAQMMIEIEGFSKNLEGKSDALLRVLRLRHRKPSDYKAFLRKFMMARDRVRVDVNEFDPAYYTYGLYLYGNVPLIDAVEHSISPMIEDFVIAVDTSGSTMIGPVEKFVEEVYSIMEQCEIDRRTNLHIIQCDYQVRADAVIKSRQDMKDFLNNLELLGGKGTDFRPVFQYVDDLIDEGQIKKLKGLIYFTDGIGEYPTARPDYPVAFLFCDDRYLERNVPYWAMKMMIGATEMVEK